MRNKKLLMALMAGIFLLGGSETAMQTSLMEMQQVFPFLQKNAGIGIAEASEDLLWETDLEIGLRRVKDEKKLLLIDFETTWCFWCKKMKSTTYRDKAVIRLLSKKFVTVSIDGDKHPDLVKKYGVRGYPTTVILNEKGETIEMLPGYVPPSEFESWLKSAIRE